MDVSLLLKPVAVAGEEAKNHHVCEDGLEVPNDIVLSFVILCSRVFSRDVVLLLSLGE